MLTGCFEFFERFSFSYLLIYFDFFFFRASERAVNNALDSAPCTVFIISIQPQLSSELMSACEMFVMLFIYVALSIIHLFIYSWQN